MISQDPSAVIFVGIHITLITVTQTQLCSGVVLMAVEGQLSSPHALPFLLYFWQLQAHTGQELYVGTQAEGHLDANQAEAAHPTSAFKCTLDHRNRTVSPGPKGTPFPRKSHPNTGAKSWRVRTLFGCWRGFELLSV
jgi:hypothetical protein